MKPGVLVISHGSREEEWVKLVDDAVAVAAAASPQFAGIPVYSSFLEIVEGRLIQDGVNALEAQGVTELFVLPLFLSSGSTHVDEIGQAFGLPPVADLEGDLGTFQVDRAHIHVGAPIDDDEEIAGLLYENIRPLSVEAGRETVMLVAHGSKEPVFHERWQLGLDRLAERLRVLGGFAHAATAMLLPDQAGERLKELQHQRPDEAVIVVPLFLSKGYFTNTVIPRRLSGLEYRYNGQAMLPHPAVARWLERRIGSWLEQLRPSADERHS
ncbi:sirohydrochlorin chelatase [Paenibacillus sp. NEAU-GSW1]|uniref:sirohydrochlorin chelatase n=1 Tax=Paenibacillus sp. NEAU-GSW1 TaxID=2682486 RepID=UPI0012E11054|nr:CbiX/SirB N-terminal domain-containing protein [Paenibacillus sp. NEAU-GSW1]MUT65650.1 cobalamin biosynthesis protein CbiX [Paenibacillus sp. NEAU-GSW1]